MDLSGYFGIARRWWIALLGAVILAAVGGYAVASQLPRVYEAEVRVLVGPVNTNLETQRAAGQLANTYAELVTSRPVSEAVIRRVGSAMSPIDLQAATSAIANDVTRILLIRVQDTSPERAAGLANAVAEELGTVVGETTRPEGQITIVEPAAVPTTAVAPQILLIVMLAAFAGLLAAISVVVLIEFMRDAVRNESELRELAGVPVLGRLPTRLGRSREFPAAVLSSRVLDAYRAMSARIQQSRAPDPVRSVLVAGGQSTGQAGIVAAGLALAFADRGARVGLVDANPDHPDASLALGAFPAGPAAPRDGQVAKLEFTAPGNGTNGAGPVSLSVVPRGRAGDVVRVETLKHLIDEALADADVVVIASPSVDRSPEVLMWADVIDAAVLVVPLPGARRQEVRGSVEAMELSGLWLAGIVVTEPSHPGSVKFPKPRAATQAGEPEGARESIRSAGIAFGSSRRRARGTRH